MHGVSQLGGDVEPPAVDALLSFPKLVARSQGDYMGETGGGC